MFSTQFGLLTTAMITPFKQNLEIDYEALEKLINHLIVNGSDSLLITGTTGENPTLEYEEEWELLNKTKEIVQKRVPIMFGAGSNSTKTAIQVSVQAEKLGADAILSVAPYYNKPNQDGIFAHFSEIAKAVKLPIMLYNNPGRTCSHIFPETALALNEQFGHINAIKESSGSLDLLTQFRLTAPNLEVYCGDDNLILPSLAVGAVGAVSVSSHLAGKQIKNLIQNFFNGKMSEAVKIHYKLFPLFKAAFSSPSPGPIKYALSELKICEPYLRLPLTETAQDVRDSLNEILKNL